MGKLTLSIHFGVFKEINPFRQELVEEKIVQNQSIKVLKGFTHFHFLSILHMGRKILESASFFPNMAILHIYIQNLLTILCIFRQISESLRELE